MKNRRQQELVKLIKEQVITTQDELQEALQKLGFTVTQSTVSRDIKELRIIKSQDENGIYRYLIGGIAANKAASHYEEMFSRAAIDVLYSMNTVVIKCYPGMASSACVALDKLYSDMVLGSLAGDDTIMAITKNEHDSEILTRELKKLI
ncbi:MAG: hypothetical protein J6V50_01390 [Clostridia bacterium]|nr:hypothetical protein [Clostridia bacterium]